MKYITVLLLIIITSCTQDEYFELPQLGVLELADKQYNKVMFNGHILSDGGANLIDMGICWSLSPNPSTKDHVLPFDSSNVESFTIGMENLRSNIDYYVCAYATNREGTSYGEQSSFILWLDKTEEPLNDIDNNTYSTVRIGDQVWMQENLKVKHYNNGDPIPELTMQSDDEWLSTTEGAYCFYDDNVDNMTRYGCLYNSYVVLDSRNVCPDGWHVPNNKEWTTLIDYLGGYNNAGNLLKYNAPAEWDYYHANTNNLSGFTTLPAGMRTKLTGDKNSIYAFQNRQAYFLIPEENTQYEGRVWYSNTISEAQYFRTGDNGYINSGRSVRCIKD
ncbi:fibrobacter succinogenes major paralogous domain-containing protein [Carboxylicivirga sp. M1479]|uniref:fibrobacter succinogenes major paralogous domain-containing protein n=1 Tax=Carboxylicivirga sp. M1479 TaxID=2594476 RepID=UPI001178B7DE|nr:fibrobacter succinogenes major paralogous domain-containing protein [Carboxylicivirga sp. M1479]TRX66546.1 hypothetical protein FNN09_12840 [Carboxylicivirga sp. M1479]